MVEVVELTMVVLPVPAAVVEVVVIIILRPVLAIKIHILDGHLLEILVEQALTQLQITVLAVAAAQVLLEEMQLVVLEGMAVLVLLTQLVVHLQLMAVEVAAALMLLVLVQEVLAVVVTVQVRQLAHPAHRILEVVAVDADI